MPAAPFSLFPGYANAAQVYLGFNSQTGYLSGNATVPTGSNLPQTVPLARYGAFNRGLIAPFLLFAFPVIIGHRRGMVPYLNIIRFQTDPLSQHPIWPYGNTTGVT